MAKLTIVRGLPGSGKSTFIKNFTALKIDRDDFFTRDGIYEWSHREADWIYPLIDSFITIIMATMKCDIVVCDVFPTMSSYSALVSAAEKYQYDLIINKVVKDDPQSIHDVDPDDLAEMINTWEDDPREVVVHG